MVHLPSLTALMVSSGVLVVDQDGRRWCMLGRHGFTMSNGVWWWGSPAGLLCEVTTASTVAALEAWCAARPDWFTLDEGTTASTAVGRPSW